jgi:hypothetical protein
MPAVILLLALGWGVGRLANILQLGIPDLDPILPVLGTIGLVLIVLEGALDLNLNKDNLSLIKKSIVSAFIPTLIFSLALAYAFYYFTNATFKIGLVNAIPFAVISSAIAIPSAHNLSLYNKSFVIFESSMSDIFGVIFFNFIALNEVIDGISVINFTVEIIIMLFITLFSTALLALLLGKINHRVKFAPIIIMIVLVFAIGKFFHLPSLIFILIFGLFLSNIDEIKNLKYIQIFKPDILKDEINKFKELTAEFVFLIRSLFFLVFGFLIDASKLLNEETMLWSLGIISLIYGIRLITLLLYKLPLVPLLFIAPRGLISILLFLSIPASQTIEANNNSLIIQVIVLTSLIMMIGTIFSKNTNSTKDRLDQPSVI